MSKTRLAAHAVPSPTTSRMLKSTADEFLPGDGTTKKLRVQLATRVRFRCLHMNKETELEVRATDFVIGRGTHGTDACLDLGGDVRVSRRHARVWNDGGVFWIEDVASKFGTLLDGREIKGAGRQRLIPLSRIQVGDTTLALLEDDSARVPYVSLGKEPTAPGAIKIDSSLAADAPIGQSAAKGESSESLLQRQSWLLELHLELAAQRNQSELFSVILRRAVEAIPGAERGAVLMRGKDTNTLLLAAFVSDGDPPVSDTLARKAMQDGAAFMWRRPMTSDSVESVRRLHIESGIYAPLIREGRPLGVICVDNPHSDSAFTQQDLRLMQALAHYASMAVSNQQMQDELRENAVLLERLLTNFSPKLRNRIVGKAREGRLRPGGERSEVTILFADMRRFAISTANRDADEVMELLNDYLPALAQIVFKYEGTIDKFTGDGLLAVFGSPEPDAEQHRHAVMAAWEMQQVAKSISERRAKSGAIACDLGVGLNSGLVLHGFLGSAEMLEFTVIGEVVNRASRFCSGAAPGAILLSPEIYQHVFQHIRAEPVSIEMKNEGKFKAYRLLEVKHPAVVR